MSNITNELDISGIGNGDVDTERIEKQTVRTAIPTELMEIIRNSGTNPNEVKGMYLGPRHPLNPFPGKHFIGENAISSLEFDKKLVSKLESVMLSEDLDSDLKEVAVRFAERIDLLVKEEFPKEWVDISKKSILTHEETHRDQNVRYQYLETFEEAAKTMRGFRDRIGRIPNPELEKVFDDVNGAYKSAFIQTEVQALIRGLGYLKELPEEDSERRSAQEAFGLYWMGKVFSLFSKYEGNKRSRTMFDETFMRIKENKMLFEDLDNIVNQFARVIVLTGDKDLVTKIQSGEINREEIKKQIINGLSRFVTDPAEFITRAIESGLSDDKQITEDITKLKTVLVN